MRGALARQQRGAWLTTTANLWGVLALDSSPRRSRAVPVAGAHASLTLGRGGTQAIDWARGADGRHALPLPLAGAAGAR